MEIGRRRRLLFDERFHIFLLEKILSVIYGLIAHPNFRHIANGLASAFHKNVLAIQQIPIYMIRHLVAVTIKQLFGGGTCRNTETDNYAVNVRLYFSLAVPAERAIGKINMHTVIKQRFPKVGNALPLRYRICGNKR